MRLEIYVPRASAVHALHPATKLALLAVAIVAPLTTLDPALQALALAAAGGAALAGRVLRETLAPWKLLLFLFAVTFGLWGWLGEGGALAALGYGLRVTTIFVFGLVFLATTRIEETIHALGAFGVPFRLAFAIGLAFRLVPLFLQSAGAILDAQRARGLDLARGGPAERLRKYVPVLVPIFMTSLRSADQMAMALEARGFASGARRTRWRAYRFGRADLVALAAGAACAAAFALGGAGALTSVPR